MMLLRKSVNTIQWLSSSSSLLLLLLLLLPQQKQEVAFAAATPSQPKNVSDLKGYNISVHPLKHYYHLGEEVHCKYNVIATNSSNTTEARAYFGKYRPIVMIVYSSQLGKLQTYLSQIKSIDELYDDDHTIYNYIYDMLLDNYQPVLVKPGFTGPPLKWSTICALQCILIDMNQPTILDTSSEFWVGLRPINVSMNKNLFIPGESIQLTYSTPKYTPNPTALYADIIEVFAVPYSYTNDPTLFNNATVVADTTDLDTLDIIWKSTGLFQLVVYSRINRVIRCISDVFRVVKKEPTIKVRNSTLYPGQNITITISFDGDAIPVTGFLAAGVIDSTLSRKQVLSQDYYPLASHGIKWNSTSSETVLTVPYVVGIPGLYKVVVFAGGLYLGESDVFTLNPPLVELRSLQKSQYFQGETVKFNIHNPYIDTYVYLSDLLDHYTSRYVIVSSSTNDTNDWQNQYRKIYDTTSTSTSTIIVPYTLGSYKIILERYYVSYSKYGMYEELLYTFDIPNSTFTVARNYAVLSTTTECIDDCGWEQLLNISLTTQNKIPLYGPYTIEIVEKSKELGKVYYSKKMRRNETAGTGSANTIHTTLLVKRENMPDKSVVRIGLDYYIWALSNEPYECYCP